MRELGLQLELFSKNFVQKCVYRIRGDEWWAYFPSGQSQSLGNAWCEFLEIFQEKLFKNIS